MATCRTLGFSLRKILPRIQIHASEQACEAVKPGPRMAAEAAQHGLCVTPKTKEDAALHLNSCLRAGM